MKLTHTLLNDVMSNDIEWQQIFNDTERRAASLRLLSFFLSLYLLKAYNINT